MVNWALERLIFFLTSQKNPIKLPEIVGMFLSARFAAS